MPTKKAPSKAKKPIKTPPAKASAKPAVKAKPASAKDKKPAVKAPVKAPEKKAPAKAVPEKKVPAKKTSDKHAPEKKASVKKAPEKKALEKAVPEKKVPAKKIPEKQAPEKKILEKNVSEAPAKQPAGKTVAKPVEKTESMLIVPGVKFLKVPFFFDAEKDEKNNKRKQIAAPRTDKPTASSRPRIGNVQDTRSLVELLSQQLEHENKMYFEGCEGQTCVKCNNNNVDPKFYVDKSLGYCVECATRLGLGQSKEGVFSDAQMELMRRSMEKSIESAGDLDEDNIDIALDDIDSLELEEALLAVEEEEFNA